MNGESLDTEGTTRVGTIAITFVALVALQCSGSHLLALVVLAVGVGVGSVAFVVVARRAHRRSDIASGG